MQDDGAESGAAHPRVRYPHHVLDALPAELHRYREVAGLGHAGRALRPRVAQHEHVVGRDVEVGRVDPRREIVERIEHDGATAVGEQRPARRRMLDHGTAGREIAAEHRDRAARMDRIVDAPNDLLRRIDFRRGDHLAQRPAGYRRHVEMQQWSQLAQHRIQAAGLVQVLHVVQAGWLQIDQHRNLATERIERVEIDLACRVARRWR